MFTFSCENSLKSLILALSNPTSQSECTAEEAYTWSKGQAIFASAVEYEGKVFVPGQANNAYIFPGFGLGLIISNAICVRDEMLLAASEALAAQVSQENYDKGLIYPPFSNIRKISAHIAANVAARHMNLVLFLIYLDLRILSNMQKVAFSKATNYDSDQSLWRLHELNQAEHISSVLSAVLQF
nr:NADP-dependent malic enzyme-like [Arachis hypogaea]